jgi:hypothetical protein
LYTTRFCPDGKLKEKRGVFVELFLIFDFFFFVGTALARDPQNGCKFPECENGNDDNNNNKTIVMWEFNIKCR